MVGRINDKIARMFSFYRHNLFDRKPPVFTDRKHRDRIRNTPVGAVQKLAVAPDMNVGTTWIAFEVFCRCADSLKMREFSRQMNRNEKHPPCRSVH